MGLTRILALKTGTLAAQVKELQENSGGTLPSNIIDDKVVSLDKTYSSQQIENKILEVGTGNHTDIIDDAVVSLSKTYSSQQIENKLSSIDGGTSSISQQVFLNKITNDVLNIPVLDTSSLDKCIIQPYKLIPGEQNITQVLKRFDNAESSSFYYDSSHLEFSDAMRIKDNYLLQKSLNSDGYYESEVINKGQLIELYGIGVLSNE